jgi:ATP-grasp ribosomal peptide maturase
VSPTVLVITARFDPTADRVVESLHARGAGLLRMDLSEFPQQVTASARFDGGRWSGRLRAGDRTADLEDLTGIYYRRPSPFAFPDDMSPVEAEFAGAEARLGFGGLLAACPNWLNHPRDIAAADASKPWQLVLAELAGLRVPDTLVTNDPDEAARFASDHDGTVALKPFGPNGFTDADGSYRIAYARKVTARQVRDESIRLTMHQLQQWIDTRYAVRLTMVDNKMFAAAIHPGSAAARQDWRSDYNALTYERIVPPPDITVSVIALARLMRLRFAAIDFLVDQAGRWWFLEIGANAQWAWIPQVAEDIASAIASALTKGPCT